MKIAVIFDFDETLVDESTSAFIESLGIDVDEFWQTTVGKLIDQDWDPVPAYMFKMIEASLKHNITKDDFIHFASKVTYKNGVETLFTNLKEHLSNRFPEHSLEYYIISSGIGEIIRHTSIAKHFTDIWSSDFEYDSKGQIIFPKKVLSFTDKTRYIFQISKGMVGEKFRSKPYIVNEKYNSKDYVIPFKNMIYLGDGLTDVPCFSLLKGNGGKALAVYDAQNTKAYSKAWQFVEQDRVSNLNSANFEKGSDLYNSLIMAIEAIAEGVNS